MAFDEIYREIAPKLQSYLTGNGCSYASACDIVQETFLRLWKRRDELEDDLNLISGLVFTIARNYRNDLARKAQREVFGDGEEHESEEDPQMASSYADVVRPGEEREETIAACRRLKSTLSRMPSPLLEIFALSRLGSLSVKDIALGTGVSESNVKVRVHRAREMFLACYKEHETAADGDRNPHVFAYALLRAMMMLAAIDGEISKEELSLYRQLAEEFKGEDVADFESEWDKSVRAMAYIGFLTELLQREVLIDECVRGIREAFSEVGAYDVRRVIDALELMANADGDYSPVERDLIHALKFAV